MMPRDSQKAGIDPIAGRLGVAQADLLLDVATAYALCKIKTGSIVIISHASRMILLIAASGAPAVAYGQADPYHITEKEKAACTPDAERLCASSYPDERKLLACMEANKASLSSGCLVVFNAGIKRRHLGAR